MTPDPTGASDYKDIATYKDKLAPEYPAIVENRQEFDELVANHLKCIFPQLVIMQIQNVLAVRHILPQPPDDFELIFTFFGYDDVTPDMRQHQLTQMNFIVPAGLNTMADGKDRKRAVEGKSEPVSVDPGRRRN